MRPIGAALLSLIVSGMALRASSPAVIQTDWQHFYRAAGRERSSVRYATEVLFDVAPMLKRQKIPLRIQRNGKAFSAIIWRPAFPPNVNTQGARVLPFWETMQLPSVFPSNFATAPGDKPAHAYYDPLGSKISKRYCRQWLVGDCTIRLVWIPHGQTTLSFYQYGREREADLRWLERPMTQLNENDPIAEKK